MVNRLGNNPGMESTGPLKRIADPANLQSQNPEIQAAAKIKQDQDLAPQKDQGDQIPGHRGLRLLSGCERSPGRRIGRLLGRCSLRGRWPCHAAGNPCKQCEKNGCCNAVVMNKFQEMAYGQDDQCVREAVGQGACCGAGGLARLPADAPGCRGPHNHVPWNARGNAGGEAPHTIQPRQERPTNAQ